MQSYDSEPFGGLLALQYWRDGRSGQSFPSTWKFLLEQVGVISGRNIAEAFENEAINNPSWSKDQLKKRYFSCHDQLYCMLQHNVCSISYIIYIFCLHLLCVDVE